MEGYGQENNNNNIDFGLYQLKELMPLAITKYYVDRKLPENNKNEIKQMIESTKESMIENIQTLEWHDDATKQNAIQKVVKMKEIFYIQEDDNSKSIYELYKYIDFSHPLTSHLTNKILNHGETLKKLMIPITNYSMSVNAFYRFYINAIFFPAAILHSPMYDSHRPDYLNYGSLGTIIGHELTHAFDSNGKYFDSDGNYKNWWTDDDSKDFNDMSQCFIHQYNLLLSTSESNVGEITLAENLADNGGLNRGNEVWKKYILKHPEQASQRNQKLPGLSDYTLDQLFFIAFGQVNCQNDNDIDFMNADEHSSNKYRVNVVLSNSKSFAESFNCPKNAPMNPENKCHLW